MVLLGPTGYLVPPPQSRRSRYLSTFGGPRYLYACVATHIRQRPRLVPLRPYLSRDAMRQPSQTLYRCLTIFFQLLSTSLLPPLKTMKKVIIKERYKVCEAGRIASREPVATGGHQSRPRVMPPPQAPGQAPPHDAAAAQPAGPAAPRPPPKTRHGGQAYRP